MSQLIFRMIVGGSYSVIAPNGVVIGFLDRLEDGFFYWKPPERCGHTDPRSLRQIADKLDEMNKEWSEQIDRELKP